MDKVSYSQWLEKFAELVEEPDNKDDGPCYLCYVLDGSNGMPEQLVRVALRTAGLWGGYEDYRDRLQEAIDRNLQALDSATLSDYPGGRLQFLQDLIDEAKGEEACAAEK